MFLPTVKIVSLHRSPGNDPFAIWRKASELAVNSQGDSVEDSASEDFARLVAVLPGLNFVIEHFGGMDLRAHPSYDSYRKALDLVRLPNIYLRLGGLGEITNRPPVLSPEFAFGYTPPLDAFSFG